MKKPAVSNWYADEPQFIEPENYIRSGVHDCGFALYDYQKDNFVVYELSKATGNKHGYGRHLGMRKEHLETYWNMFLEETGYDNDFSKLINGQFVPESIIRPKVNSMGGGLAGYSDYLEELVNYEESHLGCHHHIAHSYCGYIQSPFRKCVVLSYDGGSNESSHRISIIDNGKLVKTKACYDMCYGLMYNLFSVSISEIHDRKIKPHQEKYPMAMDAPGKFMGYAGLGKEDVNLSYIMKKIFMINSKLMRRGKHNEWIDICKKTAKNDYDIAYNAQKTLEWVTTRFLIEHKDWLDEGDGNLIITGGIALNVLNNSQIRDLFKLNVYVPPNPNDSGLALGTLAHHLCQDENFSWNNPKNRKSLRFATVPVKDYTKIPSYIEDHSATKITLEELAKILREGKIVGTVWDNIESGPRALGHRSILCDPSVPNMKDTINSKVKFREWFRPFAPICRANKVNKHFSASSFDNLENMSFIAYVKTAAQKQFPAITHVDGTARLQTVHATEEDIDLYNLLGYMPNDVLVNTSFNVGGKPILNTVEEALWMLDNTGLDHVVVKYEGEFYLFGT